MCDQARGGLPPAVHGVLGPVWLCRNEGWAPGFRAGCEKLFPTLVLVQCFMFGHMVLGNFSVFITLVRLGRNVGVYITGGQHHSQLRVGFVVVSCPHLCNKNYGNAFHLPNYVTYYVI